MARDYLLQNAEAPNESHSDPDGAETMERFPPSRAGHVCFGRAWPAAAALAPILGGGHTRR